MNTIEKLYQEARNERDFIMKCSNLAINMPQPTLTCAKVECEKVSSNKKKEKTMYDEDMDMDTDSNKVDYLKSRVNMIRYQRDNELTRLYGLRDDARPTNFNEFLERINAGKYTIEEKDKSRPSYSPLDYIRWRDPSVKEDHEGYEKAEKALTAATTAVRDTIVVMSDDSTRLQALRDFEKTAQTIQ